MSDAFGDRMKEYERAAETHLDPALPIYSGGLGILSGDSLKASSDLGLPLVAVGLLYGRHFCRQYLNADGWQQEEYPEIDWYTSPVVPVLDEAGRPRQVRVVLGRGRDEDPLLEVKQLHRQAHRYAGRPNVGVAVAGHAEQLHEPDHHLGVGPLRYVGVQLPDVGVERLPGHFPVRVVM